MRRLIGAMLFAVGVAAATSASAVVVMRAEQLRGPAAGVRITARGSLDLTGLDAAPRAIGRDQAMLVAPDVGHIAAGVPGPHPDLPGSSSVLAIGGAMINPAPSLGAGGRPGWWSIATEGFFAISGEANEILLPGDYVSGAAFQTFTSYVGAPGFTLASLGLDEGRYRFDLANGEQVRLNVTTVPLPAALPLALAAAAALGAVGLSRRVSAAPRP